MTEGQIWQKMLQKKVFTIGTLMADIPPAIKPYVKEKIKSLIAGQMKLGLVKQVSIHPPVFAIKEATDEDINRFKRVCPICGNKFFPAQFVQEFCSKECRQKHYLRYHKRRREKAGMKVNSRRRWSSEEEQKLIQLKQLGYTYEEIAQRLGRTTMAVIEKYKALKGVRK